MKDNLKEQFNSHFGPVSRPPILFWWEFLCVFRLFLLSKTTNAREPNRFLNTEITLAIKRNET